MSLSEILGLVLASLLGIAVALFRRYYMPPMPSLDRLDTFPPEDYIPSSIPPIMAPTATSTPKVENVTETKPSEVHKPTVEDFCEGLKQYEGWILPGGKDWSGKVYPKGSNSYQCNNPGNVRFYTGGYLPKYLPVIKSTNNFAIFKDYETGWCYLNEMVKTKIRLHPEQTILDFMKIYAPVEDDNDPVKYTQFLTKRLGVDNGLLMKELV